MNEPATLPGLGCPRNPDPRNGDQPGARPADRLAGDAGVTVAAAGAARRRGSVNGAPRWRRAQARTSIAMSTTLARTLSVDTGAASKEPSIDLASHRPDLDVVRRRFESWDHTSWTSRPEGPGGPSRHVGTAHQHGNAPPASGQRRLLPDTGVPRRPTSTALTRPAFRALESAGLRDASALLTGRPFCGQARVCNVPTMTRSAAGGPAFAVYVGCGAVLGRCVHQLLSCRM